MNARLQVEHPVSELVTGVDIVVEQLRVAAGQDQSLSDPVEPRGAALECRINAEDPERGFRPSPGRLEVFHLPTEAGPARVRVDTHLAAGEEVSPFYDSLLAKVIAHGETREQAIETLIAALSAAEIEGVATTIPLHLAVLTSAAFRRGDYDTAALPGWNAAARA
jgi:acetyl-CoA carboxylase biotin carboxylase subunit